MKRYLFLLFLLNLSFQNINAQVDPILKNGFWFDLNFGIVQKHEEVAVPCGSRGLGCNKWGRTTVPAAWARGFALHAKVGNKWYYPKGKSYQLGFQFTWLGGGKDIWGGGGWYVDIGALGFCSVFKLNEKTGIEANFNVGPSVYVTDVGYLGVEGNIALKYRIGYLAIGTNFRYFRGKYGVYNDRDPIHIFNVFLSLGCKF
ncbi:hypothetical protein [Aureispira anguillae]|uniref:Outer membrane protein beta-barrel domain-containing protein n=1 Tax=Aureispira anguillae TaxID=2864201 RepID=A0A915YC19_9BACT|nr:hypothetical protein [Aureispira anguillae]BDS10310.1 hypothetical protein AsAng_0010180 [Aureispira anguillae]